MQCRQIFFQRLVFLDDPFSLVPRGRLTRLSPGPVLPEQFGTIEIGFPETFRQPVFPDPGVVSRQENGRHRKTPEHVRPGIMVVFQQPGFKAVLVGGTGLQRPVQKTRRCVHHDQSGQFAARQDVITDGNFVIHHGPYDPGVNAFVPGRDQDNAFFSRQFAGRPVRKRPALGRETDNPAFRMVPADLIDGRRQRLGPKKHAFPAAVNPVVNLAVTVQGMVFPQVLHVHFDQTFVQGPG